MNSAPSGPSSSRRESTTSLMRQRIPFLARSDEAEGEGDEDTREVILDDQEQQGLVQHLSDSLDHSAVIWSRLVAALLAISVPLILPSPTRSFLLALLIRLSTVAPLASLSFLLLAADHTSPTSSNPPPASPTSPTSTPSPSPNLQLPLLHVLLLLAPLFISLFTLSTDWRWSTPLLMMGLGVEVSRTIKTQQHELVGLQRLKYRLDGA